VFGAIRASRINGNRKKQNEDIQTDSKTTTERNKTMKTKPSKQQRKSKPLVQLKDLKPKKDAKGGRSDDIEVIVGAGAGAPGGHVKP
jgi:hypothetical protein